MSATRVLVVSDLYPPFPGGAERLMFNLARHLYQHGANVQVLTGYGPALAADGPPVWAQEIGVRDDHAAGAAVLTSAIAEHRPDVLLAHHFYAFEFEAELVGAGVPLVQVVLNTRRIEQAALAVFISEYVAGQHDRQPQDMVIPPPVFSDVVAPSHGDAIGFIKPIVHKGVELLYQLAAALPERRFVVLRGEWQHIELINVMLPNVTFMEPVVDMRDFYAECRLLLVPSLSEDAGTVAQEAAANGLPCLASAVGGLLETAAGGVLLPPDNLDAWQAAVVALDDPDAYRAVVAAQTAHLDVVDQAASLAELAARIDQLAAPLHVCDVAGCEQGFVTMAEVIEHERTHRR